MIIFAGIIDSIYPWLQKGLWVLEVVVAFGLLVGIHEFGHFISAKLTGMKVEEFSIGFGKMLLGRKYGETQYSIRIVPLGGYCKIYGMEDDPATDPDQDEVEIPEEELERGFNRKPLWARLIVIVAGSFMNIVMAIILIGFMGVSIGYNYSLIEEVEKGSPADIAGIKAGDKIRNFAYSSSRGEIIERVSNSNTVKGVDFRINHDDESRVVRVFPNLTTDENGQPVKRIGIRFSTEGNYAPIVDRVMLDSPFQRAGLLRGDEISSVNRSPVDSLPSVYDALLETGPSGEVELEVLRGEKRYPLTLKDHLIYRTGLSAQTVLKEDGESYELVVSNAIMGTPAFYLNLTKGTRITEIDGAPITSDFNWAVFEEASDAKEFMIKVYNPRLDNEPVLVPLSRIMLHPGISFKAHFIKVPFFASFGEAILQTKAYSLMIFDFLGSLFSKEAGIHDVAGPIGIAQIGYRMASSGLFNLMSFFTIISINLAIINMLPIPGLDGGRTVFLIFEFLFRRPIIGARKENIVHLVGLLLFLGLFLYVAFNDVGRLISSY